MGGFVMLVLACQISGASCQEYEVRVSSLFSCQIHGQAALAKWLRKNPGRYVKRWTCDPRRLTKV